MSALDDLLAIQESERFAFEEEYRRNRADLADKHLRERDALSVRQSLVSDFERARDRLADNIIVECRETGLGFLNTTRRAVSEALKKLGDKVPW